MLVLRYAQNGKSFLQRYENAAIEKILAIRELFSDALIDVADEGCGFFAPLFIVGGGGFGGDGFV